MEEGSLQCVDPRAREAFTEAAMEWRQIANMARQQEAWEALNPRTFVTPLTVHDPEPSSDLD